MRTVAVCHITRAQPPCTDTASHAPPLRSRAMESLPTPNPNPSHAGDHQGRWRVADPNPNPNPNPNPTPNPNPIRKEIIRTMESFNANLQARRYP